MRWLEGVIVQTAEDDGDDIDELMIRCNSEPAGVGEIQPEGPSFCQGHRSQGHGGAEKLRKWSCRQGCDHHHLRGWRTSQDRHRELQCGHPERIEAVRTDKTKYKLNERFDLDGLTVTAIYRIGDKTEEVPVKLDNPQLSISGFDSSASGRQEVAVSYRGVSATFTV